MGFALWQITARGGEFGSPGGAGTIYLKSSPQLHGDLIVDNGGFSAPDAFTPLRAVGVGASTGLAPSTLTNATADFPAPSAATGALGLIGLELNPNTAQGQTFTILDNTPTDLFTDAADGDMTLVASPGDQSIGVYTFDNLSVTGAAEVETADQCVVIGTLDTSGGSLSCAPFPIVPVP